MDVPCRNATVRQIFDLNYGQQFPYSKADTLFYVSNSNDSLRITSLQELGYNYTKSTAKMNPDCAADSDAYRLITWRMADSLSKYKVVITASKLSDSVKVAVNQYEIRVALASMGKRDSTFSDSLGWGVTKFYNLNKWCNASGDSFYYSNSYGLLRFVNAATSITLYKFNKK
jgi:hypothetical protein